MANHRRVLCVVILTFYGFGVFGLDGDQNIEQPVQEQELAHVREKRAAVDRGFQAQEGNKLDDNVASNLRQGAGKLPQVPQQQQFFQNQPQVQAQGNKLLQRINPNVADSLNRDPQANMQRAQFGQQGGGAFNNPGLPPAGQQPVPRRMPIKLADHPDCAADVKAICSSNSHSNNFAVLDCLQNDVKSDRDVSEKCQNFVWQYKRNLTRDMRFDTAASEVCTEELKRFPDCANLERGKGLVIPCLIEQKPNVTNASCKQFLTKMASIVFSDYRLIYKFAEACDPDIARLQCGRTPGRDDDHPHSQGRTVECLSEHVKELDGSCKHEILRIAELQADDYHMDRPLFYACRDDRERFCARTRAGSGKVYKCLFRHKFEREMSSECQKHLVMRQKLMQEDYKINKGLAEACRQDIREHNCLKSDDVPKTKIGRMSHVLLCLEGAQRDGGVVSQECIAELADMRRSLMEDYKISPDLVASCAEEIQDHCKNGLEQSGKTMHCLMDLARPHTKKKKVPTATLR